MDKQYEVVTFGTIVYDCYEDGTKALAGSPLTVSSYCSQLGLKSALISAINKNDIETNELIKKRNIISLIQKNKYPTGMVNITGDKNNPQFEIISPAAYEHIEATNDTIEAVKNCDYFCFSSSVTKGPKSRETLMKLLEQSNAKIVYDANIRRSLDNWKEIISEVMPYVNILKVNTNEMILLKQIYLLESGNSNMPDRLFNEFSKLEKIFLTMGEAGAVIYDREGLTLSHKSNPIEVIDTVGCGDCFTANVIYGLIKNKDIEEILTQATDAATQSATYMRAFPEK